MQSPLFHQLSSVRGSLNRDDPAPNYQSFSGQNSSMQSLGLRPRAPHGGLPLSSLAGGSNDENMLAATLLDLSSATPPTNAGSSSIADQAAAAPQSKSEQDLAHYLATSNSAQRSSLGREQTLLNTSISGEWLSASNSLGGVFDRTPGGLMTWSVSDSNIASSSSADPTRQPPASDPAVAPAPYSPRGYYYPPTPTAERQSASNSPSISSSHPAPRAASSSSMPYARVPIATPTQVPSSSPPTSAPLSLPIPAPSRPLTSILAPASHPARLAISSRTIRRRSLSGRRESQRVSMSRSLPLPNHIRRGRWTARRRSPSPRMSWSWGTPDESHGTRWRRGAGTVCESV
ncbi:hypothetical protein R3P38DRAFT_829818 [Favolaschia claudopus]|uniref:Uncharacterized protein n=1 Tax=Favolaschia claudopus TaxID=2862362 RepID=A0AAW0C0L0_9AGAR